MKVLWRSFEGQLKARVTRADSALRCVVAQTEKLVFVFLFSVKPKHVQLPLRSITVIDLARLGLILLALFGSESEIIPSSSAVLRLRPNPGRAAGGLFSYCPAENNILKLLKNIYGQNADLK